MAHSVFIEPDRGTRDRLLLLVRNSIIASVSGAPLPGTGSIDAGVSSGVFVTLKKNGELRGCIGVTAGAGPTAQAVQDCAIGAAFRDPRFPPVLAGECDLLEISISLLSAPEPMLPDSRAALLAGLRPGIDGLIVELGRRAATFLPQVWEQLPEPEDFLYHLLRKAGLPGDYWSPDLRCSRYRSFNFAQADSPGR